MRTPTTLKTRRSDAASGEEDARSAFALHPTQHAAAFRAATDDLGRARARNALAGAIRALSVRVLEWCGVPKDASEDVAHVLTLDVLVRIESGEVLAGRESAYTKQCARHRATDYHRQQSGVRARVELTDDAPCLACDDDAETLLVDREEAAQLRDRMSDVCALVASAPPLYRRLLEEVYVRGARIEGLVQRELAARVATGELDAAEAATKAAKKRARDVVDKQLQRARDWVRARLRTTAT